MIEDATPPHLSVVIPAYDEAERIGATLVAIREYLSSRLESYEIIVVDDGSRDGTAGVVEQAQGAAGSGLRLVRLPHNRGKGFALRQGVAAARGEILLISDADLSTPIAELANLLPHLAGAPLVIGSRALETERVRVRQPLYRQQMGRTFNRLVRALLLPGIGDTQCGFKLFAMPVAQELFAQATIDRFAWDVEVLYLARRRGLAIREVAVDWYNSPASRVRVVTDSLRMLRDVVRIWWRAHGRAI